MNDYISREEAITAIEKVPKGNWRNSRYVNELQSVPAADVRPVVRGKWVPDDREITVNCSECGAAEWYIHRGKYCSSCGAQMDEGGRK